MLRPSSTDLIDIASIFGMVLDEARAEEFLELLQPSFDLYEEVDRLDLPRPNQPFPRNAGHAPAATDNPCNAWAWRTEVAGAGEGPLAGRTIALKDNIALAGVPMSSGSPTLDGYVPSEDATVVQRILAAGGIITGKAVCEHFSASGGSHTSATGPVQNPRRAGFSAGGSSSGSAALVGAGAVDMAIGADQGGSIRIPASYCGIYGMKPTHGLVPYTGIMPIDATIDHAGPMSATVSDNALLLDVVAGADGLDPRQAAIPQHGGYRAGLGEGCGGMTIGLLKEGFSTPGMTPEVAEAVRAAAKVFERLGATVVEVSVPDHALAAAIWTPIVSEGLVMQMMLNGTGFGWKGRYDVDLLDAHSRWREQPDDLHDALKLVMFLGQWGLRANGRYYAKAQNLAPLMRAAYDAVLEDCDLLLVPTTPCTATPLPAADASLTEIIRRGSEMNGSTCQFDLTGHPAFSMPCGMSHGLPVGMSLIARHWDEARIYRAAYAFEQDADWQNR